MSGMKKAQLWCLRASLFAVLCGTQLVFWVSDIQVGEQILWSSFGFRWGTLDIQVNTSMIFSY